MKNQSLYVAKIAKNDEFYTQYYDIEKEITAYLEFNPNVFKGKTILLPCDDPEWSNFTKYFAQNFEKFGLKELISTSYAHNSKKYKYGYQPTLFETDSVKYDEKKTKTNGKIFTLSEDKTGDGKIDVNDLEWNYMEDDGDFRSNEVTELRNKSDVIITNPPFSLFREFLSWIMDVKKLFVIIGNKNCITYKEVFPLIKDNKMWVGSTPMSYDILFDVPKDFSKELIKNKKESSGYKIVDGVVKGRSQAIWLANIDHGRRHKPLDLMSMKDNLRFNKKLADKKTYDHYDNYDAIEVPFTELIPNDYEGVMGVPISFLDKYNPEQFEIIGTSDNGIIDDKYKITQGLRKKFVDDYYKAGGKGSYKEGNPTAGIYINGIATMAYKRLFIKHRKVVV